MVGVAKVAELGRVKLTNQQIADLMFSAEQDRRMFVRAGKTQDAAEADAEVVALAALLSDA